MVFQTARWLYRAGQWLFVYLWVLLIVPLCSAPNRGSFGPTHVLDPGLLCGVLCKLSLSPAQGACPSSSAQLRESALQPRFSTRRQDASSAGLTPSPQWRPALRAALLITAQAWHWGIAWRAFLEVDLLEPVPWAALHWAADESSMSHVLIYGLTHALAKEEFAPFGIQTGFCLSYTVSSLDAQDMSRSQSPPCQHCHWSDSSRLKLQNKWSSILPGPCSRNPHCQAGWHCGDVWTLRRPCTLTRRVVRWLALCTAV